MRYAKIKDGDYVVGIATGMEQPTTGEAITEEEYAAILSVIQGGRQKDERLLDDDGTYRYVVVPGYDDRPVPEPEDADISPDEALDILMGVSE